VERKRSISIYWGQVRFLPNTVNSEYHQTIIIRRTTKWHRLLKLP
jgi:hypothetical protein